jgi:hypothetical protein
VTANTRSGAITSLENPDPKLGYSQAMQGGR